MTLPDGVTDKYVRFHDAYIKHSDGTLDVVRGTAKPVVRLRVGAVNRRRRRRNDLEERPFRGLINGVA
jgi:hypothetical protein